MSKLSDSSPPLLTASFNSDNEEPLTAEKTHANEPKSFFENLVFSTYRDNPVGLVNYLITHETQLRQKLDDANRKIEKLKEREKVLLLKLNLAVKTKTSDSQHARQLSSVDKKIVSSSMHKFVPKSKSILGSGHDQPNRSQTITSGVNSHHKSNELKPLTSTQNEMVKLLTYKICTKWDTEAATLIELFNIDTAKVFNGELLKTKRREDLLFRAVLCQDLSKVKDKLVVDMNTQSFLPASGFSCAHLCIMQGCFDILRTLAEINPAILFLEDARGNLPYQLFFCAETMQKRGAGFGFSVVPAFQTFLELVSDLLDPYDIFRMFDADYTNYSQLSWKHVRQSSPIITKLIELLNSKVILMQQSLIHSSLISNSARERYYSVVSLRKFANTTKMLQYALNVNRTQKVLDGATLYLSLVCDVSDAGETYYSWNYMSPTAEFTEATTTFATIRNWDSLDFLSSLLAKQMYGEAIPQNVCSVLGHQYVFANYLLEEDIDVQTQYIFTPDRLLMRKLPHDNPNPDVLAANLNYYEQISYSEIKRIRLLPNCNRLFILDFVSGRSIVCDIEAKYYYLVYLTKALLKNSLRYTLLYNLLDLAADFVYPVYDSDRGAIGVIVITKQPKANHYGSCLFVYTNLHILFQRYLCKKLIFADTVFNVQPNKSESDEKLFLIIYEDRSLILIKKPDTQQAPVLEIQPKTITSITQSTDERATNANSQSFFNTLLTYTGLGEQYEQIFNGLHVHITYKLDDGSTKSLTLSTRDNEAQDTIVALLENQK